MTTKVVPKISIAQAHEQLFFCKESLSLFMLAPIRAMHMLMCMIALLILK